MDKVFGNFFDLTPGVGTIVGSFECHYRWVDIGLQVDGPGWRVPPFSFVHVLLFPFDLVCFMHAFNLFCLCCSELLFPPFYLVVALVTPSPHSFLPVGFP